MPIARKANSPFFWYDFRFAGNRYRGSTRTTNKQAARHVESEMIRQLAAGDVLTTFGKRAPLLRDFLDTANVIDTLDLVISVDSAVAHLAASQGAPTWILLPFVGDWRGMRPDAQTGAAVKNPWYPQARVFRQRDVSRRSPSFPRSSPRLIASQTNWSS